MRPRAGRRRAGGMSLAASLRLDVRSLALFRVSLAALVLFDTAARGLRLAAHYTDAGLLPREAFRELIGLPWPFSLHFLFGGAWGVGLLFALQAAGALALLLGFRTRAAAFVVWLLVGSLHARNPMILNGGDTLLRLLLFWSLFLPLGAAWSFDARRGRPLPEPALPASFALRFQVAAVYLFGWVLKSGPAWRDGTAVYYALSLDQSSTALGRLLLGDPTLMAAATHAVFWWELAGGLLLLLPFVPDRVRTASVFGFVAMHLAFAVGMSLGIFPFVSCASVLTLLPRGFWDGLAQRRRAHASLVRSAPVRSALVRSALDRPELSPARGAASALAGGLALLLALYVLAWNLDGLPPIRRWREGEDGVARATPVRLFRMPARAREVGRLLLLDQRWALFAPEPSREDGWWVAAGTLADGRMVDLLRGGAPVSLEKPEVVAALFPNARAIAYADNLTRAHDRAHWRLYAAWLCADWNATHARDERVAFLEAILMREETPPPGRPARLEPVPFGTFPCAAAP